MSKEQRVRPRLGRGLSSLMSVSDLPVEREVVPPSDAAQVQGGPGETIGPLGWSGEIPVDQVTPNPHQPRRTMNEASLAELAASLKATGLVQPIIVRRVESGYQLIAGERRWRAAKLAGLTTLPAIIRDVDALTQAQMALVENIQREDLNPIDRAHAYRALLTQLGLTQAELGVRLGEDRTVIANYLRLLDLSERVRDLLRDGKLSLGHAKLLAGVSDPVEQDRLAELVVGQELSVRNLERLLQDPHRAGVPKSGKPRSAHLAELEKDVARQLGLRVQVRGSGKRGRLIIHYGNLEQFDELMSRLGVQLKDE